MKHWLTLISQYTLPRIPRPFPSTVNDASASTTNGAAGETLTVTLSALRQSPGSPSPVTLSVPAKASIYDVKTQLASRTGYSLDKLKILWERKPINDSKLVSEATGSQGGKVEMGVMYMGAPTNVPQPEASGPPSETAQALKAAETEKPGPDTAQQQHSGHAVLETTEFWDDLQGYLTQRLRDDTVAKEAADLWRRTWKSR